MAADALTPKEKLPHRKAALEKLSPLDWARVDGAINAAKNRLSYIGEDGALELVAALGEWLAAHKTGPK